jgi:transcriptional regulator with XRE-family HTH domain
MSTQYKVDLLRKERLRRGWTMSDLARRIGVTPPVVSRVEAGETQNPKTVAKMAKTLGLELAELVR